MNVTTVLTRSARKSVRAARFEALARFREQSIRDDTVLYEAFAGTGVLCNPEAIFREILSAPDLGHLRHVWVLDRAHLDDPATISEFRRHPRVSFVLRGSLAYFRAVSTSGYLINNATFPVWFSKRPGQIYLNTWHGTPLKAMGYDMPDGARESANTLRNFVAADYLLAQNSFMTETMYASAYKLAGHFQGRVIEEGYPRVDRQSLDSDAVTDVLDRLSTAGVPIGGRRIVLYAPTWRGASFGAPSDDVALLLARVADLQSRVGDDFVVLLKTHQILERFVGSSPALGAVLVPGSIPTNTLLGVVDTLVTDYSSIFFDFLATGRRIVFFAPDGAEYGSSRGMYFDADELPGPVCTDESAVAEAILQQDPAHASLRSVTRDEWQERFVPGPAGSAARVVDAVFRGRTAGLRLVDLSSSERSSVLIHVGNLSSNGITSAALNLLASLPTDRYDVSIAFTQTTSSQQVDNSSAVVESVRQFARDGGMNGSKLQHLRRRLLYRRGVAAAHREDPQQRRLWDDEWQRCFGASRFDVVIDFSGYSPFWSTLLLHSPGGHRSVWMHNDMVAEVGREVGGRRPLGVSLPSIFGLYREYDALVAVSPSLAEINQAKLSAELLSGRTIGSAVNVVDAEKILRLAAAPVFEGERPTVDGAEPPWAAALRDDDDAIWFVTVGRYTREKNHERLLMAFRDVHADEPRARLLVVGHGPLEDELRAQVDRLGLAGIAFITGALRNPFAVLHASDCFVLSSDYEGQPMVLLEAAVLGMPIVSTEFGSIEDALPDGIIRVVEASESGLAGGLREFLGGAIQPQAFDVDAYNAKARDQFAAAVGLPAAHEEDAVL
ncbi:glycosyltransferase [Frondihabitans peucedani]|uniref:Glycosyl transferase family 1 domain-containing protein n=1 Tax=Frondihabitans peucedani TaxID=598626 RepID=A0ABP8E5A0_9MICO